MTACISKDALKTSMCVCSTRFNGGEIFIKFFVRFENNSSTCFCLVSLSIGMGYTCLSFFDDTASLA
ncbi:hypothetical protein BDR07DRAFT_1408075 [Suillus spraguei]|nr:hypothetical protein BDR07DRAFT_1446740 [Suillus spraguei]KAG2351608.1 hypothetical protein BDR07DRAFT_1443027 [Suillus spraguei]KAG2351867.1 hypothetical protein BDR07DRAFT_1441179 [Suillus spraguei]KAG2361928.1 hypothetical protein BDR07DRAFT_1408075 [Suillus spraguei]